MNIFRLLGTSILKQRLGAPDICPFPGLQFDAIANLWTARGLVPFDIDTYPTAQDEDFKRMRLLYPFQAAHSVDFRPIERVRHIIQIPISLPDGLRDAIYRPSMDILRAEKPLQHRL